MSKKNKNKKKAAADSEADPADATTQSGESADVKPVVTVDWAALKADILASDGVEGLIPTKKGKKEKRVTEMNLCRFFWGFC